MLSKTINEQALQVAEKLTESGKIVTSKSNGAFGKLISETYQPLSAGDYNRESIATALQVMQRSNDTHKEIQTDMVGGVTNSLNNSVNTFRGDVVGSILRFHDAVMESYEQANFEDLTDSFSVQELRMPLPMEENLDALDIRKYTDTPLSTELDTVGHFGVKLAAEDMPAFLATGNHAIDSNITEWITHTDAAALEHIWDTVFNERVTSVHIKDLVKNKSMLEGTDTSMLIYLGARALKANISPSAESLDGEAYTNAADDLIEIGGVMIMRGYAAWRRAYSNDNFIVNRSLEGRSVTVLADTYTEYLNKGGSINSLLGSIMAGHSASTTEAMTDMIFKDDTTWKAYVNENKISVQREKLQFLKTTAKNIFVSQYANELTAVEELYYAGKEPSNKPIRVAHERIDEMNFNDMGDIYNFSREVVGNSRFHFTAAEEFLSTMSSIRTTNPDVSADEAAFLSTVDYVAEYIANQLDINSL